MRVVSGAVAVARRSGADFNEMVAWRQRVGQLKAEIAALGYACRDPRVPWYAKALAVCVVAYALSPVDLIPDPIPVLGYLDDLILVPLGILLAVRMVPPVVMTECRERARASAQSPTPSRWVAAALIVAIWLMVAGAGTFLLWRIIQPE